MADLELPDGFAPAGAAQVPDGFAPAPVTMGSVLPVSWDANDKMSFNSDAGLLGMAKRAFAAPYDAMTGALPTPYSPVGATTDTAPAIDRAIDFASVFGPTKSAAARAGEVVPGASYRATPPPSAQQLKAAGGAGYDAARASGLAVPGDSVAKMATDIQRGLTGQYGIISETAPKTFALLDKLANPEVGPLGPSGTSADVTGLLAARKGLSDLRLSPDGTERLAAGRATADFDNYLSSLAPGDLVVGAKGAGQGSIAPDAVAQTLADARGNYAAAQRSNDITGTLDAANTGFMDRAEARAAASNSGHNLDNAVRQRVATFLQNPSNLAGFSQPEIDALNGVVAGGPLQNTLRSTSNILGGGGGMHGGLAGVIGAGIGHALGGVEGGMIGAGVPLVGLGLKGAENSLARRSLNNVDEMVRMRSPLYQSMNPLTPNAGGASSLMQRALIPAAPYVAGQILPGLLAPRQLPDPLQAGLLSGW
jgi:hypothetical protein